MFPLLLALAAIVPSSLVRRLLTHLAQPSLHFCLEHLNFNFKNVNEVRPFNEEKFLVIDARNPELSLLSKKKAHSRWVQQQKKKISWEKTRYLPKDLLTRDSSVTSSRFHTLSLLKVLTWRFFCFLRFLRRRSLQRARCLFISLTLHCCCMPSLDWEIPFEILYYLTKNIPAAMNNNNIFKKC